METQVVEWVKGWRIPDEVGAYPMGAVVPSGTAPSANPRIAHRPHFGRTAARTWHTLIVRSRPRSVILVDTPLDGRIAGESATAYTGELPHPTVRADERLLPQLLQSKLEIETTDTIPTGSSLATHLRFVGALAPGCPVVALFVAPQEQESGASADFGDRLGHELMLDPDVLIVASSDLTRYGDSYGFAPAGLGDSGHRWLRQNDARMIRHMQELAAEDVGNEAFEHRNASAASAIAVALGAARVRGSSQGHLLEYTTSFQASDENIPFTEGTGYAGIVF